MARFIKVNKPNSSVGFCAAIVDDADYAKVTKYIWYLANRSKKPYVQSCRANGVRIYLSKLILGLEVGDGKSVFHINGNSLDYRRANLRVGGKGKV